jgi:hypothetical protein
MHWRGINQQSERCRKGTLTGVEKKLGMSGRIHPHTTNINYATGKSSVPGEAIEGEDLD